MRTSINIFRRIVQWVKALQPNRKVLDSNPSGPSAGLKIQLGYEAPGDIRFMLRIDTQ